MADSKRPLIDSCSGESEVPTPRRATDAAAILHAGAALANPSKGDEQIQTRRKFLGVAGAAAAGMGLIVEGAEISVAQTRPATQPATVRAAAKQTPNPRPTCVAIVDSTHAVTCNDYGGVYLWKINGTTVTPKPTTIVTPTAVPPTLPNLANKASFVAVSELRTGVHQYILTALFDGTVSVYDHTTSKAALPFNGHIGAQVWTIDTIVIGTDTYAISGDNTGNVIFWNVVTRDSIGPKRIDDHAVAALAFLPPAASADQTKPHFLAGCGDGEMFQCTVDISNGMIQDPPSQTFDHYNPLTVNSIALFQDGNINYALTACFDARLRLWDLSKADSPVSPDRFPGKHKHFIWRVAAAPNGVKLASVSEDHSAQFFYSSSGKQWHKPDQTYKNGVMGVDFLDNDTAVITTDTIYDATYAPNAIEIAVIK